MKALRRIAVVLLVLAAGGSGFLFYRHVMLSRAGTLRPALPIAGTLPGKDAAASAVATANAVPSSTVAPPGGPAATADAQGETGAPDADAAPAHPVPSTLPDVRLSDLAGQKKSLQSFTGRPLIVNFWATWCAPCRREIPLLQKLRSEHAADRLEVVGIAVDSRNAVADYVKKTPIDYPLLVGEQQGLDVIQQFGMEAVLPFSVFVASNGQIVALKIGELHANEAEFILAALRRIDDGSEGLSTARVGIAQALKTFAAQRAQAGAATG